MTVPWRVLPPGIPSLTALPTHRSAAMTVPVRVLPSGVPSLTALTRAGAGAKNRCRLFQILWEIRKFAGYFSSVTL